MAPIVTHHVAHRAIMQRYQLAEGPIWDGVNNRIVWVDIATYPASGSLFLADVGARGLPSSPWRAI